MPHQKVYVRVQIERLGNHGEGVAEWNGLPLFVRGALPQEEVEVAISVDKATYRTGTLLRVLHPHPERQAPPCPFYPACGGCQLQHLSSSGQLMVKRARVLRALAHQGLDLAVQPVRPSPADWSYRCKMLMPVEGVHMGLYAAESHCLVPLSACLVHCPAGEAARSAVQTWLYSNGPLPQLRHVLMRTSHATGKVLVALVVMEEGAERWEEHARHIAAQCPQIAGIVLNKQPLDSNVILGQETVSLHGNPRIEEELYGIPVELSATSFFQVNPLQAEAIGRDILEWADRYPHSRLCDAYCGAGALALALAQRGHQVTGLEVVPSAIEDARRTALRLGLHADFVCCKAEEWLMQEPRSWDSLILNPPRRGCAPQLLERLLDLLPTRICMLYCEPGAMARDLQRLTTHYHIEHVQPYDLFPQTAHVECVAQLSLQIQRMP